MIFLILLCWLCWHESSSAPRRLYFKADCATSAPRLQAWDKKKKRNALWQKLRNSAQHVVQHVFRSFWSKWVSPNSTQKTCRVEREVSQAMRRKQWLVRGKSTCRCFAVSQASLPLKFKREAPFGLEFFKVSVRYWTWYKDLTVKFVLSTGYPSPQLFLYRGMVSRKCASSEFFLSFFPSLSLPPWFT